MVDRDVNEHDKLAYRLVVLEEEVDSALIQISHQLISQHLQSIVGVRKYA